MKKALFYIFLIMVLSACSPDVDKSLEKTVDNFGTEVNVNKIGDLYTVPHRKIHQVLPLRGNVPALNNPKYVDIPTAEAFLNADDLVMGLKFGDTVKAYPVKIMRWHPVVNDSFEDVPVYVGYDPVSDLGLAYKRIVKMPNGDEKVTFKTSDKMYNSNPLVEDLETKTKWSPYLGEAILGRLAGRRLEELPVVITPWSDWKRAYPSTRVLSIDTGYKREYEKNVYEDYYRGNYLMFEVEYEDGRLFNKDRVYGVNVDGAVKAYPVKLLKRGMAFKDKVGAHFLNVSFDEFGIFSATAEVDAKVSVRKLFWFSWVAFNPETALYEAAKK